VSWPGHLGIPTGSPVDQVFARSQRIEGVATRTHSSPEFGSAMNSTDAQYWNPRARRVPSNHRLADRGAHKCDRGESDSHRNRFTERSEACTESAVPERRHRHSFAGQLDSHFRNSASGSPFRFGFVSTLDSHRRLWRRRRGNHRPRGLPDLAARQASPGSLTPKCFAAR